MVYSIVEFRKEKQAFTKVEGGNVDFFHKKIAYGPSLLDPVRIVLLRCGPACKIICPMGHMSCACPQCVLCGWSTPDLFPNGRGVHALRDCDIQNLPSSLSSRRRQQTVDAKTGVDGMVGKS